MVMPATFTEAIATRRWRIVRTGRRAPSFVETILTFYTNIGTRVGKNRAVNWIYRVGFGVPFLMGTRFGLHCIDDEQRESAYT